MPRDKHHVSLSRSDTHDLFKVLDLLSLEPFLSADEAFDDISRVFLEQFGPFFVPAQGWEMANDDKAVLGPGQGHIDPVVLLDEVARLSSHH